MCLNHCCLHVFCVQVVEEGQRLMASHHIGGMVSTRVTGFPSPQFLKVRHTLLTTS